MRDSLSIWADGANVVHQLQRFALPTLPLDFSYLFDRAEDYYISLVGQLFDLLREPTQASQNADGLEYGSWAKLANSIAQVSAVLNWDDQKSEMGAVSRDSALMAAVAFYVGGYTASAYVTLRGLDRAALSDVERACVELITKPDSPESSWISTVKNALRSGDDASIKKVILDARRDETEALDVGPNEWVASHFLRRLLDSFGKKNVRAVLPGNDPSFWDALVNSFLDRKPAVWDFFPSQVDAIEAGLLDSEQTFSLQMPTGAGKTALIETILFQHLSQSSERVAVVLVPYRSLAAELKHSVASRLNRMSINTRCVYGGSVPSKDELDGLETARAVIATPEALLGLLAADPSFAEKISLVICDEGHLLDGGARGIGLELLLARFLDQRQLTRRFIFISAIVPNIEEINSWLGGADETVVRSEYKPTLAEFAMLKTTGNGASAQVQLELHPHESVDRSYTEKGFLSRQNFTYQNPVTRRANLYNFDSIKTQTIAAARRALAMGPVAVFAANKSGTQGAVGLAEELIKQLAYPLDLPVPVTRMSGKTDLEDALVFMATEFGDDWVGTRALAFGAILHHGDVPQETREVLEDLLRRQVVTLAICTNTLAEGVNLPLRTLVLYSVTRRTAEGAAVNLLSRDIKNLVGRAGRAGSTTKGLVICANPKQWELVKPVANQEAGERVDGSLLSLIRKLQSYLIRENLALSNELLEESPDLHALIDGVDATLIELAAEEIGDGELLTLARNVASRTFTTHLGTAETAVLIGDVFELRSRRVAQIKAEGRLSLIRDSGARLRLLDSAERSLFALREDWTDETATIGELQESLLTWAWALPDVQAGVAEAFKNAPVEMTTVSTLVTNWIAGETFFAAAQAADLEMNTVLAAHAKLVSYALLVNIEQGIALLQELVAETGGQLAPAVLAFPDSLRRGATGASAKLLMASGLRHRRIAVALGEQLGPTMELFERSEVVIHARQLLENDQDGWIERFGRLVVRNTLSDLQKAE